MGIFKNLSLQDSALPNRGNPHLIVIARFGNTESWQSIFLFFGLLRRICDSPRNNDRVGGFYFLRKQKVAKTLIRIFDLILSLDSCFARIYNRSNCGSALHYFGAK